MQVYKIVCNAGEAKLIIGRNKRVLLKEKVMLTKEETPPTKKIKTIRMINWEKKTIIKSMDFHVIETFLQQGSETLLWLCIKQGKSSVFGIGQA